MKLLLNNLCRYCMYVGQLTICGGYLPWEMPFGKEKNVVV